MKFNFKDYFLTQEIIFEYVDEISIFEFYLYPVDFTKLYTNPFRTDLREGCKYYISKSNILYFVDKAWDNKHYNCFSVVMSYYSCSYNQALKHIWEDMIEENGKGDVSSSKVKLDRKKIEYKGGVNIKFKKKKFTESELKWWSVGGIESNEKDLESEDIFSVETLWLNEKVYDNLKNTYAYIGEGLINQIYMPLKSKQDQRFINRGNFKFHKNKNYESDIHIICKSKKCSYFISRFGYSTSYLANETLTIDPESFRKLKEEFRDIYCMGDNDAQGHEFMSNHYNEYEIIPSPVPEMKDFTEFLDKVKYLEASDWLKSLNK